MNVHRLAIDKITKSYLIGSMYGRYPTYQLVHLDVRRSQKLWYSQLLLSVSWKNPSFCFRRSQELRWSEASPKIKGRSILKPLAYDWPGGKSFLLLQFEEELQLFAQSYHSHASLWNNLPERGDTIIKCMIETPGKSHLQPISSRLVHQLTYV